MIVLVALSLCPACKQSGSPPTLPKADHGIERVVITVAAASDLQFAFDELAAEFKQRHPSIDIRLSYGSSGKLYSQLSNGAPFDLFLSADDTFPRKLVEQGVAAAESLFCYAQGTIVVWVPNDCPVDINTPELKALVDPSIRRIAIANPAHAPYGRAAMAAMNYFGIYDQIENKLVFGENVSQAAQFVQSGTAEAGVTALSLVLAPSMRAKGRFVEVPLSAYPRIEQCGVILKNSKRSEAAYELRRFLMGTEGRAILNRFGLTSPGEQ